jgi:hypothetical protein
MSLLAANTPDITDRLWDRMDKAFPLLTPEPNVTTFEELMHNAGQRSVVEWLKRYKGNSIITGTMDDH